MRRLHRTVLVAALTLLLALLAAGPATAKPPTRAEGAFTVTGVEVTGATPIGTQACLLRATVTLSFTGTLTGTATGPISVLVFAPCDAPPGSAGDVFSADLRFTGTVDGQPADLAIAYTGRTDDTGAVRGLFRLSGSARGVLTVDATAGVGGTYRGLLRQPAYAS